MTDTTEAVVDPFHAKGRDGILRGLNEHYDSRGDVEQDPYGAWLAIQNLWEERDTLAARVKQLEDALGDVAQSTGCCYVCPCHMRATRKARALTQKDTDNG
jgi:hypothetical protein